MKYSAKILVVDDEKEMLDACCEILQAVGHKPIPVADSLMAIELLKDQTFDVILSDLLMPEIDGIELLEKAKKYATNTPFIILTAYGTVDRAVRAMKLGAFDFIEKPFEVENLVETINRAIEYNFLHQNRQVGEKIAEENARFDDIIGQSDVMQKVYQMILDVANTDVNVLITGESGTGKELVARSIHQRSHRKDKSFVPVNCCALPENLFEAELFGYEKGAFTGANRQRAGLIEYANGGTFFLDEVIELPLNLQSKLLRVLQDKQLRRLGSNQLIKVDIRLISASNRNLQQALEQGLLREDFYYRINVVNIHVPPLRERKDDVLLLANHFLDQALKFTAKTIYGFEDDVVDFFLNYEWPGNVRELENVIQRAVTMAKNSRIRLLDLPQEIIDSKEGESFQQSKSLTDVKQRVIEEVEKKYLLELLEKYKGNVSKISLASGMTRRHLHRLLNRHGLDPRAWREKNK